MSLLTLGVETSGLAGALALRCDGQTVESVSLQQTGRRHAQTLVSEVQALLHRAGLSAKQLDVVAVSIGPGSFTGLRVGVVFAKTLAYSVRCQLVAVDTLRAIAAASPHDVREVFVVSDAQRGDLFVGHYACDDSARSPVPLDEIAIVSAGAFCQRLSELAASHAELAVSGPAAATLSGTLPSSVRVLAPELHEPRADLIAKLGKQQALEGESADPWRLEPFYLRRSAAEEKAAL